MIKKNALKLIVAMVFQFCEYIKAIGWYTLKGLILHVNYISVKLSFKKARKG